MVEGEGKEPEVESVWNVDTFANGYYVLQMNITSRETGVPRVTGNNLHSKKTINQTISIEAEILS